MKDLNEEKKILENTYYIEEGANLIKFEITRKVFIILKEGLKDKEIEKIINIYKKKKDVKIDQNERYIVLEYPEEKIINIRDLRKQRQSNTKKTKR